MMIRRGGLVLLVVALAAGCAQTELALHGIKEITATDGDAAPNAGVYKVGDPYEINGAWYYPAEDPGYAETGLASWYGTDFHGKRTANGAVFDMNALTAAHKTLPMPTLVRVTNLKNGRVLILEVNDRGPFVRGRIIDVSRRAAQLLGFLRAGVTPVRVEVVRRQPRLAAAESAAVEPAAPTLAAPTPIGPAVEAAPATPVRMLEISAPSTIQLAAVTAAAPAAQGPDMFIQVGAFRVEAYALAMAGELKMLGPVRVSDIERGGAPLYRVRVGPLADAANADRILRGLLDAGHGGAHLVLE